MKTLNQFLGEKINVMREIQRVDKIAGDKKKDNEKTGVSRPKPTADEPRSGITAGEYSQLNKQNRQAPSVPEKLTTNRRQPAPKPSTPVTRPKNTGPTRKSSILASDGKPMDVPDKSAGQTDKKKIAKKKDKKKFKDVKSQKERDRERDAKFKSAIDKTKRDIGGVLRTARSAATQNRTSVAGPSGDVSGGSTYMSRSQRN